MKRLVLLGGGHAHVKVLADLAERPLSRWDVHLVTPYRRQIYSGMLPGWIAGGQVPHDGRARTGCSGDTHFPSSRWCPGCALLCGVYPTVAGREVWRSDGV